MTARPYLQAHGAGQARRLAGIIALALVVAVIWFPCLARACTPRLLVMN